MSRSRKRSAWEGPVPPEIMKCSDPYVTQKFKDLVLEANGILDMAIGERRKKKIAEVNRRLEDLINEAKRKTK